MALFERFRVALWIYWKCNITRQTIMILRQQFSFSHSITLLKVINYTVMYQYQGYNMTFDVLKQEMIWENEIRDWVDGNFTIMLNKILLTREAFPFPLLMYVIKLMSIENFSLLIRYVIKYRVIKSIMSNHLSRLLQVFYFATIVKRFCLLLLR